MNAKLKMSVVLFAAICMASAACADVKLHRVFRDHMVLQRDMNVNVWGWADRGENVSVQFGGQSLSAVTDDKGRWAVKLAPMKADTTPQSLTVAGKNKNDLTDIVVGDVWLCSGQSNMALPGQKGNFLSIDLRDDCPWMRYNRQDLRLST